MRINEETENKMSQVMVSDAETIYAMFVDSAMAEKAAGALMDHGVKSDDISIVSKTAEDEEDERDIANASGEGYSASNSQSDLRDHSTDADHSDKTEHQAKSGLSTTTPGDAAAGAAKGAGIGLGVGIAAALAAIFIPGFGLVVGGGALATAIAAGAGTTAAGAVAGGVHGYLKDQGVPDQPAGNYAEGYKNGSAILAVHVPSNNVDRLSTEQILSKYQASYVSAYGAGTVHGSPSAGHFTN